MNEILLKRGIDTAVYIGGMTQDQRDQATKSRVLCATYSMASEAFDLPKLNTLVMATPKKDINQVVGRILRKQHDENPMIIDVYDKNSVFERWGYSRFKFYKKRGYTFQTDVQHHHDNSDNASDVDNNEYSNVFSDNE
jgi:superfamily II DNA or RNA helicase